MEKEIWKPIEGYEGLYEISESGKIKSLERMEWRNSKKESKRIRRGKLRPHSVGKDDYSVITLCKDGVSKTTSIHRLVAKTFIPNPDNLPEVNHKQQPKTNNHFTNLEWCTGEYNRQHAFDNKLCMQSDDTAYSAKLTNEQVLQIRSEYATGLISSRALAKKYGMGSKSSILRVIHKQTFRIV